MIPSRLRFLPQLSFRLALCAALLLFALVAAAQSGRRTATGSPSVTPPAPAADAKAEKKPEATESKKDDKRQDIILATDRGDSFVGFPLYFYDSVMSSCAGRLDDAHGVKVEVVSKQTNRVDAINNAKSQKEAYVVWLQLRNDGLSNNSSNANYGDISIEFTIFEPITGKVKARGTAYQGALRSKGVIV